MPIPNLNDTVDRIIFEVLAWYQDEGNYQPTEIEMKFKVAKLIKKYARRSTHRHRT